MRRGVGFLVRGAPATHSAPPGGGYTRDAMKPARRLAIAALGGAVLATCSAPRRSTARWLRPARPSEPAPAVAVCLGAAAAWRGPDGAPVAANPQFFHESSLQGRPLPYFVAGSGGPCVLVLGAIHGDEKSSALLACDLLRSALERPARIAGRRLVVAPIVNPDGFAAGRRSNARGIDLNRNFPASNFDRHGDGGGAPLTEPESRFVDFLLHRYRPALVIALHGAAACVNYDGPARPLAALIAEICELPVKASIGYPTPGSLGSWLGVDQRAPVITFELRSNQAIDPAPARCRLALFKAMHRVPRGDSALLHTP